MMLPRVRKLFEDMDPDKPETIDAVRDHAAASLSEGLCLFCGGPVRAMPEFEPLLEAHWCARCQALLPSWVPSGSAVSASRDARAEAVKNWQDAIKFIKGLKD
jgi:hypothetical protein